MPTFRANPYSNFKFLVSSGGGQGSGELGQIVGGFADASGLGMGVNYSDYRNSNEKSNTVRKLPNARKFDEVTLKRGLAGADDLFQWIKTVRDGTADPREVQITMLDEARNPVVTFSLHNARPKKFTSSTLAANGGDGVAVEELTLVHEGIEYK